MTEEQCQLCDKSPAKRVEVEGPDEGLPIKVLVACPRCLQENNPYNFSFFYQKRNIIGPEAALPLSGILEFVKNTAVDLGEPCLNISPTKTPRQLLLSWRSEFGIVMSLKI